MISKRSPLVNSSYMGATAAWINYHQTDKGRREQESRSTLFYWINYHQSDKGRREQESRSTPFELQLVGAR